MRSLPRVLFAATILAAAVPVMPAQVKASKIYDQLKNLRSVSADSKGAAIQHIAADINTQPAGADKVKLADNLVHLTTEGDPGKDAVQAAADALAKALSESPVTPKKDEVPMPYTDLAKLVRYEHVTAKLNDPLFAKATQRLVDAEAEIQKADFTLKDLHGKKYTLSELKGKIVLVNFWATWCAPCRAEMSDLDAIYRYFQSQGLVVLSITDEDSFKVGQYISPTSYQPPVLLDLGGKVHQQFHIEGIPHTFLFGRDGKLLSVAIDQRTRRQFLEMLQETDLHP